MLFLYIYFIIFIYILKWWFILRKLLYFDDSTKLLIKEIEKAGKQIIKEENKISKEEIKAIKISISNIESQILANDKVAAQHLDNIKLFS